MKMRYLIAFLCLLISACGPGEAKKADPDKSETVAQNNTDEPSKKEADSANEEDPPATDESSPKDELKLVMDSFDEAMQDFRKAYEAAEPSERQSVFEEHYPDPSEYGKKMLAIAEAEPEDETAVEALTWVASRARGELSSKAVKLMIEHHADSERMSDICMSIAFNEPSENTQATLEKIFEENPNDKVKAAATHALTMFVDNVKQLKSYAEQNPEFEHPSKAFAASFDMPEEEVEALFQRLQSDKFRDLKPYEGRDKTYGDIAESSLFELKNLQIGKIAPDIEGSDLDGVDFKLSDYRGKVVVLDFWGDW